MSDFETWARNLCLIILFWFIGFMLFMPFSLEYSKEHVTKPGLGPLPLGISSPLARPGSPVGAEL